jgi:DNA-binding XRE family transcriptional regulator
MAVDPAYSMLRRAKNALGLTDDELAQVIGTSRQHVQSICKGVYAEHLNAVQIRALLQYARLIRDQAIEAVTALEMFA